MIAETYTFAAIFGERIDGVNRSRLATVEVEAYTIEAARKRVIARVKELYPNARDVIARFSGTRPIDDKSIGEKTDEQSSIDL